MKRISQKDFFSSISLILLSSICLSLAASFWKYLTNLGSLQMIVFIRFFFPFLIVFLLWFIIWFIKRNKIYLHSIKPLLLRSIAILAAQYSFLYVLSYKNLLFATMLYSTSGLFSPILLYIFFKTRPSNKAIISIIISFIGVAIVLKTWQIIISPISLIGLLSGLLTAIGQIIQHRTSKSENNMNINLVLFGFCSLFALILLIFSPETWKSNLNFVNNMSLFILGIILAFSVLSIANQTFKNAAFRYVNKPTTLVPYMYSTIIFSGIIDWVWLGIIPQFHVIIGVILIIAGGIILSIRRLKN